MSIARIEEQLLTKFRRSLKKAIDQSDGVQWADVDDRIEQKLMLRAIRHFDLDHHVTIQWFKDGDVLTELDSLDSEVILTNAGVDEGPIPPEGEIVSYYTSGMQEWDLEDVINTDDRGEWLMQYYESTDMRFEEIYLIEMEIHLYLKRCRKACLDNVSDDLFEGDITEPLANSANELKRELIRYPLFRNVPPYVTEFERIAIDVLSQIQDNVEETEKEYAYYIDVFSQLNKFFYNTVWEIIANRIGFYTAEGPSEEVVRAYRKGTLLVAHETFISEFDKLKDVCNQREISISAETGRLPELDPEEDQIESLLDWEESDRQELEV